MAVSGSYAYIADEANGLVVVDISDPTNPTLVGSYNTAGYAAGMAVSGSYAYIADCDNGLVEVDISDPINPTLTRSYNTAGNARSVAVSGSYAYVADYDNGLVVLGGIPSIQSKVEPLPEYSSNTTFTVNYTITNPYNLGIENISLYYNNGSGWSLSANNSTNVNGSFIFVASEDGYYEFYSIVTYTIPGREEEAPIVADAHVSIDTTAPPSITHLNYTAGIIWINWTWENPSDIDFAKVKIYLNDVFQTNVTSPTNHFNATSLDPDTNYTLSIQTVDNSGNINQTWVNNTARTESVDNINPILVSSEPGDRDVNIPLTQRIISFTFSETMQPNVSVRWWGLNDTYTALMDWSLDNKTVFFTFDRDLLANTTISWVLNPSTHIPGFQDLASNPLPADTYYGSFSTATAVEDQLIDTQNGIARLSTPEGFIDEASTVNESSLPPNPEIEFPFGVFSFNISNLNIGQTINISIELPQELPPDTKYWKFSRTISDPTPHWYEIPMEISSDNRSIKIQLTDGGLGDDDLTANGMIVDPGAPGISRKGDFSGDGTTDSWDITYLARSITGIPGYESLSSGDVSGDGVVDAWDCTYLARAIAGVPGYNL